MEKELATAAKMTPRKHQGTPWKCSCDQCFPTMTSDQLRRKAKHLGLSIGRESSSKRKAANESDSGGENQDSADEEREEMAQLAERMPAPHCTQTKWHWGAFFNRRKRSRITVVAKPRVRMMKVTS